MINNFICYFMANFFFCWSKGFIGLLESVSSYKMCIYSPPKLWKGLKWLNWFKRSFLDFPKKNLRKHKQKIECDQAKCSHFTRVCKLTNTNETRTRSNHLWTTTNYRIADCMHQRAPSIHQGGSNFRVNIHSAPL